MLKDFGIGSQILENVDNRIRLGFKLDCDFFPHLKTKVA